MTKNKKLIYFIFIIIVIYFILFIIFNYNRKESRDIKFELNNLGYEVYEENNNLIVKRDNLKFIFKDEILEKVLISDIKTKDEKNIENFCIEEWNIDTSVVENNNDYIRVSFYIKDHKTLKFLKEYKTNEILKEEIFQFPLNKKYLIAKTGIFGSQNQTYLSSSAVFVNEIMSLPQVNVYYLEGKFLEKYFKDLKKFKGI